MDIYIYIYIYIYVHIYIYKELREMRRNNSGLFLDDIDKNQETKRNFIFAGGIHSHNLIARKSDTRCSISFLPVFLFELLLFLPLPKKKAVTRCKLGISFIKQQILFATFLYTTYVGGPKRNRNFVIKNCVITFSCYKFNHLHSTVHLMQCTCLNVFSTFRSSPETLAK